VFQKGTIPRPKLEGFEHEKDLGQRHIAPEGVVLQPMKIRRQAGPFQGDPRPQVLLVFDLDGRPSGRERFRMPTPRFLRQAIEPAEHPGDPAPLGLFIGEISPEVEAAVRLDGGVMGQDIVRSDMDFEPGAAAGTEFVLNDLKKDFKKGLKRQPVIPPHGIGTAGRRLEAHGQRQIPVAEKLPANFGIAEEGHIGDQGDRMPVGFELVEQGINVFTEKRLSEDVEKDRGPQAEGLDLVEEAPQPAFREVPFRAAKDVRGAKDAMHVAMAGQLDKNCPEGGGYDGAKGRIDHFGFIILETHHRGDRSSLLRLDLPPLSDLKS
jgi:hypothetical protein